MDAYFSLLDNLQTSIEQLKLNPICFKQTAHIIKEIHIISDFINKKQRIYYMEYKKARDILDFIHSSDPGTMPDYIKEVDDAEYKKAIDRIDDSYRPYKEFFVKFTTRLNALSAEFEDTRKSKAVNN